MKKWALVIHIILRSIIPPFYSFELVESICLRRLRKDQSDKNVLWFLANFYISYKQFEKSKFQLEALQEYYGDLRGTILLLSKTYYRLGEYTKVVDLIEHSGELKGKDKENYYFGKSLFQLSDYQKAISYLERYVKHHNQDFVPFVELGYAYSMTGQHQKALNAYQVADKINPEEARIKDSIKVCEKNLQLNNES